MSQPNLCRICINLANLGLESRPPCTHVRRSCFTLLLGRGLLFTEKSFGSLAATFPLLSDDKQVGRVNPIKTGIALR
jgi:hypothetical protein